MNAPRNGGFPEPLGGHGIRLVDSRHDGCGHSTRVRLPSELGAQVVRRVVCELCSVAYETTRVEDCGIEQELADLTAAMAPAAPSLPPAPVQQPEPEYAPVEPEPYSTPVEPEPVEPELVEPELVEPIPFAVPAEPDAAAVEPEAVESHPFSTPPLEPTAPAAFEQVVALAEPPAPEVSTYEEPTTAEPSDPSPFDSPAQSDPSPFEHGMAESEPVAPSPFEPPAPAEDPSPFEHGLVAPVPESDPSPFEHGMAQPEPADPSPFESSAPVSDPSPFESSAPVSDPSPFEHGMASPAEPVVPQSFDAPAEPYEEAPAAPSPFESSDAPAMPSEPAAQQLAAEQLAPAAPAVDSSFTSPPQFAEVPSETEPAVSQPPPSSPPPGFAPTIVAPPPSAPDRQAKRKTAIGPEIKLPSLRRKPKPPAVPAAGAPTAEVTIPVPPSKPKRKTAIGPELKMPSFKRKPKAAAPPPAQVASPVPAPPSKPKRKTAIGPELKMPSFKRKPKPAAPAPAPVATPPAAPAAPNPAAAGPPAAPAEATSVPAAPAPAAMPPAAAAPAVAEPTAKPKRKTAIGPELKMPSFKRKPKPPRASRTPAAASSGTASAAKPKRKTAIGPELKMPSFKRKPKPARAGRTSAAASPVASAAPTPAPAAKPKRKTAIGPELKMPSFKRKPKAARTRSAPNTSPKQAAAMPGAVGQSASVATSTGALAISAAPFQRKQTRGASVETRAASEVKSRIEAGLVRPVATEPASTAHLPGSGPFGFAPSAPLRPKVSAQERPPVAKAAAIAPKRKTAIGPELTKPSFNFSRPSVPSLSETSWRRLSVPIAAGAVLIGLLLLRGGGDDGGNPGKLPTNAPATKSAAPSKSDKSKGGKGSARVNSKNAEIVAGSNFTLALPKGWDKITPTGGATFAALASDGSADATLWIKRDPSLDFAQFEANSLDQLKQLGGSAKVIDRQQGPTVEQTVVTLGTDAPKGAPDYQVELRASGPYFYYLATTAQPNASSESIDGVNLIQDSLLPTGSAG